MTTDAESRCLGQGRAAAHPSCGRDPPIDLAVVRLVVAAGHLARGPAPPPAAGRAARHPGRAGRGPCSLVAGLGRSIGCAGRSAAAEDGRPRRLLSAARSSAPALPAASAARRTAVSGAGGATAASARSSAGRPAASASRVARSSASSGWRCWSSGEVTGSHDKSDHREVDWRVSTARRMSSRPSLAEAPGLCVGGHRFSSVLLAPAGTPRRREDDRRGCPPTPPFPWHLDESEQALCLLVLAPRLLLRQGPLQADVLPHA